MKQVWGMVNDLVPWTKPAAGQVKAWSWSQIHCSRMMWYIQVDKWRLYMFVGTCFVVFNISSTWEENAMSWKRASSLFGWVWTCSTLYKAVALHLKPCYLRWRSLCSATLTWQLCLFAVQSLVDFNKMIIYVPQMALAARTLASSSCKLLTCWNCAFSWLRQVREMWSVDSWYPSLTAHLQVLLTEELTLIWLTRSTWMLFHIIFTTWVHGLRV